jgi:hypothetical protein
MLAFGALRLAACVDTTIGASKPIQLPDEFANAVYTGHAGEGRAIAFVRNGQLFVADHDRGITFALEPAHGDTPPMVLAIAEELVTESKYGGGGQAITLTSSRRDQPAPGVTFLGAPP